MMTMKRMKTSNIDIDQFINLLLKLKKTGNIMIDLEILREDDKDRIIIHPVKVVQDERSDNTTPDTETRDSRESDITISDPDISTDDDSIYEMFKNVS